MKEVIEEYQSLVERLAQLTQLHSDCLSGTVKDFKLSLDCKLPNREKAKLQFDEDGSIVKDDPETHWGDPFQYTFGIGLRPSFGIPDRSPKNTLGLSNIKISETLFVKLVEYLIQDYTQRLASMKAKLRKQLQ